MDSPKLSNVAQSLHIDGDFVLSRNLDIKLPGFSSEQLSHQLTLHYTDGLKVCIRHTADTAILILGIIYDPSNPDLSIETIAQTLNEVSFSPEALSEQLVQYGGSYVVIVILNKDIILFTDPCAFRKVYYRTDCSVMIGPIMGSTPELIAHEDEIITDLKIDQKKYKFIGTAPYLPADLTEFTNIKHLVPSCYVNALTGQSQRFFPKRNIPELSYSKVIDRFTELLTGSAQAVMKYWPSPIMVAITAGFDSRTTLAAFHSLISNGKGTHATIGGFTFCYPYLSRTDPDITIAEQVCQHCNIGYNVIKISDSHKAESIFANEYGGTIINSNIADIFRVFYRLPRAALTPKFMCNHEKMPFHPSVLQTLNQWFKTLPLSKTYECLDQFYWDHRLPRWGAQGYCGSDIPVAKANIFNVRIFYHLMQQVPYSLRKTGQFQKDLIESLSPGLTDISFNPPHGRLEQCKKIIKNSAIEPILRYIRVVGTRNQ